MSAPGPQAPPDSRAAVGIAGGGGLRLRALLPPPRAPLYFMIIVSVLSPLCPAAAPQPPGAPSAASLRCSIGKATRSNFAETRPLRRPGPRVRPQPSDSAHRRTQDRRSLVRPAGCRSAGGGRRAGAASSSSPPGSPPSLPHSAHPPPWLSLSPCFSPSLQLLGELSLFLHKRHFLFC